MIFAADVLGVAQGSPIVVGNLSTGPPSLISDATLHTLLRPGGKLSGVALNDTIQNALCVLFLIYNTLANMCFVHYSTCILSCRQ